MFLHDAIGVGLFVVINHHVGKSAGYTGSCSPVNESIKMAKTVRDTILSNRSAAASKVYATARQFVDGRGKVRRRFIGKRANGFLSSGLAPAVEYLDPTKRAKKYESTIIGGHLDIIVCYFLMLFLEAPTII